MHQRYTNVFDQRLANVSPKFFDRISTIYRHPLVEFTLITPKVKMKKMRWTVWLCWNWLNSVLREPSMKHLAQQMEPCHFQIWKNAWTSLQNGVSRLFAFTGSIPNRLEPPYEVLTWCISFHSDVIVHEWSSAYLRICEAFRYITELFVGQISEVPKVPHNKCDLIYSSFMSTTVLPKWTIILPENYSTFYSNFMYFLWERESNIKSGFVNSFTTKRSWRPQNFLLHRASLV